MDIQLKLTHTFYIIHQIKWIHLLCKQNRENWIVLNEIPGPDDTPDDTPPTEAGDVAEETPSADDNTQKEDSVSCAKILKF